LVLLVTLALAANLTRAQGPDEVVTAQAAVGTAFTYQGRLTDNGVPADGVYDFRFILYDAASNGTQVGSMVPKENTAVTDGVFTVELDFSSGIFTGEARYLEIGVRPGDSGSIFTTLSPRQELTPAPYALSLRPGAVVDNASGTGHGLEVRSSGSHGSGSALWAESEDPNGIAIWAHNESSDVTLVTRNAGTGDLIKGFGGDGGEDEFRVQNDGTIMSKAHSYVFVPGTAFVRDKEFDPIRWNCTINGGVQIWSGESGSHNRLIHIPITLPAVLYGQQVDVYGIAIYYICENGSSNYITATELRKQTDAASSVDLWISDTDHSSEAASWYGTPLIANNALGMSQGILDLSLLLHFENNTEYVQIGGVRLDLVHHPLY
jgi:hypothetical protein